jgi:hypothetical protein
VKYLIQDINQKAKNAAVGMKISPYPAEVVDSLTTSYGARLVRESTIAEEKSPLYWTQRGRGSRAYCGLATHSTRQKNLLTST